MMKRDLIELGDVTQHIIKQVMKIHVAIFPIIYNEKFYAHVLKAGELAKVAYYNDIAVGAVCCRIEGTKKARTLYVMTLGCLKPYRRLGVGTKLLEHLLNYAKKDGAISSIYLHVQVNNLAAVQFYKKFGFEIDETKAGYYRAIEPSDAYILRKTFLNNTPEPNGQTGKKDKKKDVNPSDGI